MIQVWKGLSIIRRAMPAIVLTGQNTRLTLRSLYWMSVKTERAKQPTAPTQTRMEKMELSSSTSGSKILELTDCEVTAQKPMEALAALSPSARSCSRCSIRTGT